jgi:transcriptional regulator
MSTDQRPEFLRGTLDRLVLKVVALEPLHGCVISQRIQQISRDLFQAHQASLYPALHRLEDRGLLQAEWRQGENGREAKFYFLTRNSRKQLEAEMRNWDQVIQAVSLILRTAE